MYIWQGYYALKIKKILYMRKIRTLNYIPDNFNTKYLLFGVGPVLGPDRDRSVSTRILIWYR